MQTEKLLFKYVSKMNSDAFSTTYSYSEYETNPEEQQFLERRLRLGDGNLKNDYGLEYNLNEIPAMFIVKDSKEY